ncbi:MAG: galactokinase [Bryobacteraceae bacterium]
MALTSRELTRAFQAQFSTDAIPACYRAPGRVNMMGEHTDYNQGLVCPMALEMACYAAIAPAAHGEVRVYSANLRERKEWSVNRLDSVKPARDWGDYVLGVAGELARNGYRVPSCSLYIESEVPEGAGLSSSASLEVAAALAFLGQRPMAKLEIAKLCQRAESSFVGMPCGIMDQYASIFGQQDSAIQIDCRTLESEAVRLPREIQVLVVNSMVKHELGSSAYRKRVKECQEAVAAIRQIDPAVESLRDVTEEWFESIQNEIPVIPRKRARHVVTDNARVLAFAAAARRQDLKEMGRLFVESHQSARDDYEISCEELDFLVETAMGIEGVYGARMTGGGFGGCTVNLVAPNSAPVFLRQLTMKYQSRFSITPVFYECIPAEGAGPLENQLKTV